VLVWRPAELILGSSVGDDRTANRFGPIAPPSTTGRTVLQGTVSEPLGKLNMSDSEDDDDE
jgi:hypothetical protein